MGSRLKRLNVLLNNGSLDGLYSIEEANWQDGIVFVVPRDKALTILELKESSFNGTYILIGREMLFVGDLSSLHHNLPIDLKERDWWQKLVVITSKNNSLAESDAEYILSTLVDKSSETDWLAGSDDFEKADDVGKYRQAVLDEFLDNALFILEFIGIKVFSPKQDTTTNMEEMQTHVETHDDSVNNEPINSASSKDQISINSKDEAKVFLKKHGVSFDGKYVSYARRQSKNNTFWNNARAVAISKPWSLILNNQFKREIIVLDFPANAFETAGDVTIGKVRLRKDKPYYLDLNIDSETFIDFYSKLDFSKYIAFRISY